jgi:hypothetical protein
VPTSPELPHPKKHNETETTVPRTRRQLPLEREQELLRAFIEAYSATETRVVVDRFLKGLFSAQPELAP